MTQAPLAQVIQTARTLSLEDRFVLTEYLARDIQAELLRVGGWRNLLAYQLTRILIAFVTASRRALFGRRDFE